MPGGSVTIRYCPVPSVTTERAFSISAGLLASTVTPGSTAPDGSLTTPVIEAWAKAAEGIRNARSNARTKRTASRSMEASSLFLLAGCCERQREAVGTDAFANLLHARRAPRGDERRRPGARQHLGVLDKGLIFDGVC